MNETLYRELSLFADKELDPDDTYKKIAFEYIDDCGVDVTDTYALMNLSMDVADKLEDIMKKRHNIRLKKNSTNLDGIYKDYCQINYGLMSIIFNQLEERCNTQKSEILS